MVVRTLRWLAVLVMLLPLFLGGAARAQTPVVYGVFFYSPSCSHCHEVITNHWPGIQSEFGDQLQVLFINVATQDGIGIMRAALQAMGIESSGVPMLVIGDHVLVGSLDIPQQTPGIVRAGLAAGGIGYPPIPGIDEVFEQALAQGEAAEAQATDEAGVTETEAAPTVSAPVDLSAADSAANTVAIGLLIALLISLITVLAAGAERFFLKSGALLHLIRGAAGQAILFVLALVGLILAVTLLAGSSGDPAVLVLSGVVALIFALVALALVFKSMPRLTRAQIVPMMVIAGLIVAGYLAYVEVTASDATCGAIGDCNAVQQSPYASVMGLPVGVLGIIGYVVILVLWALRKPQAGWVDALLLLVALFGVAFSTYLTYLEPFVIGATCTWCLLSAVTMLALLWILAPAGWKAIMPSAGLDDDQAAA